MVWRGQFGERNGSFGGWISKPGYDVTTAAPGNFLLDTNSQVFQIVLRGTNTILVHSQANTPAGTATASISLPSAFSSFSRLFVSATFTFYASSDGSTLTKKFVDPSTELLYWSVSSGVLTFYYTHPFFQAINSGSITFIVNWTIYRGQF